MGALAPVALAAQAIGTIVKGVSDRDTAYRAAGDDYENGRLSILAGEQEVTGILDEERMAAGASLADQGGTGLQIGGSITTLIEQSALKAEQHAAAVRQRAFGEAKNYNARGDEAIRAGKGALVGAMFSAVSGALAGASDLRASRLSQAQAGRERSVRLGNSSSLMPSKGTPMYGWAGGN